MPTQSDALAGRRAAALHRHQRLRRRRHQRARRSSRKPAARLRAAAERAAGAVAVAAVGAESGGAARAGRALARLPAAMRRTSCRRCAPRAGERRSHYDHRLAAVAGTIDELRVRLRAFVEERRAIRAWASGRRPKTGPAAPGVRVQRPGPAVARHGPRTARERAGVPRQRSTTSIARFRRHRRWSLLDELAAPAERSRLDDTEVAQPAIFAMQVALAALWAAWGIKPDGVVGHSIGEIAALHVAGVLTLDDALRVVAHRGRVMQRATGQGAMAAVGAGRSAGAELLRPHGASAVDRARSTARAASCCPATRRLWARC